MCRIAIPGYIRCKGDGNNGLYGHIGLMTSPFVDYMRLEHSMDTMGGDAIEESGERQKVGYL